MDKSTRLVALFGYPVAHSFSPSLHNAAFAAAGLDFQYNAIAVPPEELGDAVRRLRAVPFVGANVTIPHKRSVVSHLDDVSDVVSSIGAANTIVVRSDGRDRWLYGDNTDVPGFLAPLRPHIATLFDRDVVVLGTGGSARAIVYALLTETETRTLFVAGRNAARVQRLLSELAGADGDTRLRGIDFQTAGPAIRSSRLVVNTTPVGMHPLDTETPWPAAGDFSDAHIVYDLVYRPAKTRLLREAETFGATTIGGLDMLIAQAAGSYEMWTGQKMPLEAVHNVLREMLAP